MRQPLDTVTNHSVRREVEEVARFEVCTRPARRDKPEMLVYVVVCENARGERFARIVGEAAGVERWTTYSSRQVDALIDALLKARDVL